MTSRRALRQTVGLVRELLLLLIDFLGLLLLLHVIVGWLLSIGVVASLLLKGSFLFFLSISVKKFRVNFWLADTVAHGATVASGDGYSLLARLYDLLFA